MQYVSAMEGRVSGGKMLTDSFVAVEHIPWDWVSLTDP